MESHSHHNTALYYIWENNCSSPSACLFDLQQGDICVLGRNDGYKVIYVDKVVTGSSVWADFHVIDTLTEYNLNLPKEHEILCSTGADKAVGNEVVLKRLIDVCKNEWVKDFLVETQSIIWGLAEFWNLKQLIRLTGDYCLMYVPKAKTPVEFEYTHTDGSSLYYVPETDTVGRELLAKNVKAGDYCICRNGNGLTFIAVDHNPNILDTFSSFAEIESVEETNIMFPLVFLQLCKIGVKKEKNIKFLNRFKSAFSKKRALDILELAIKIAQGENVTLPKCECSSVSKCESSEYVSIATNEHLSNTDIYSEQKDDGVVKSKLSFKNLPENSQLDIEIEFLKSVRKQTETRNDFQRQFSSAAAFYTFAKHAEDNKGMLKLSLQEVYKELLESIVEVLTRNAYDKSIVEVFVEAIDVLKEEKNTASTGRIALPVAKEIKNGSRWSVAEENLVSRYFKDGYSPKEIADAIGRTEVAVYMRLDKLGLVEYTYEANNTIDVTSSVVKQNDENEEDEGLYVKNSDDFSVLYNKKHERLFSSSGYMKIIGGKVYRFNYKDVCFTVKRIEKKGRHWMKSGKLLVAFDDSQLYSSLNEENYIDDIDYFFDCADISDNRIMYKGVWYDFDGEEIKPLYDLSEERISAQEKAHHEEFESNEIKVEHVYIDNNGYVIGSSESSIKDEDFVPKSAIQKVESAVKNCYDALWLMSYIDIVNKERLSDDFTLEQIACMEIANLWEIINADKSLVLDDAFYRCKEFLMDEVEITDDMNNKSIYNAIKDYPICGAFEDFVDVLTEMSHINLLKAWINETDDDELIAKSARFANSCLYSVTEQKYETKIRISLSWRYYVINHHKKLRQYFMGLLYKWL